MHDSTTEILGILAIMKKMKVSSIPINLKQERASLKMKLKTETEHIVVVINPKGVTIHTKLMMKSYLIFVMTIISDK